MTTSVDGKRCMLLMMLSIAFSRKPMIVIHGIILQFSPSLNRKASTV